MWNSSLFKQENPRDTGPRWNRRCPPLPEECRKIHFTHFINAYTVYAAGQSGGVQPLAMADRAFLLLQQLTYRLPSAHNTPYSVFSANTNDLRTDFLTYHTGMISLVPGFLCFIFPNDEIFIAAIQRSMPSPHICAKTEKG